MSDPRWLAGLALRRAAERAGRLPDGGVAAVADGARLSVAFEGLELELPDGVAPALGRRALSLTGGPAEAGRLYSQAMDPADRAAAGAHHTPEVAARWLASRAGLSGTGLAGARVLDPAVGGGALLLAAREAGAAELHGVDRDAFAVALARGALWVAGVEREAARRRVVVGDALGAPPSGAPFDAVLMNPPWLDNKRIPRATKDAVRAGGFAWAHGLWDLAVPFVERALALVRPGGVLGLVLPARVATRDYAARLRSGLLASCTLLEAADVSRLPLFADARTYPLLLVLRRRRAPAGHRVRLEVAERADAPPWRGEVCHALLARAPVWPLTPDCGEVERLLDGGPDARHLGETLGERRYRPLGFAWKEALEGVEDAPADGEARELIGCANVLPMRVDPGRPLRLGGRTLRGAWLRRPADVEAARWAGRPQLLVRELAKELTAAFDAEGRFVHLTGLYGYVGLDGELPGEYVAALLNSATLRRLYRALYWTAHLGGGYLDIKGSYLARLPIRPTTRRRRASIVDLARRLTTEDDERLWARLDGLVREVYA